MLNQTQIDFDSVKYYNTTDELDVTAFKRFNLLTNDSVLGVFKKHPDKSFTPFEVHDLLKESGSKMELTSVRRAISDLTDCWELIRTDEKVIERLGRPNYKWKLKQ